VHQPLAELAGRTRPVLERYLHSRQQEALELLDRRTSSSRAVSGMSSAWLAARTERPEMLAVEQGLFFPARLSGDGDLLLPATDVEHPDVLDDAVDELIELVLDRGGWVALVDDGRSRRTAASRSPCARGDERAPTLRHGAGGPAGPSSPTTPTSCSWCGATRSARLREIAAAVGVTERAVQLILGDLEGGRLPVPHAGRAAQRVRRPRRPAAPPARARARGRRAARRPRRGTVRAGETRPRAAGGAGGWHPADEPRRTAGGREESAR
jgi:hypothetical protein